MSVLDDQSRLGELDPAGMYQDIFDFPHQLDESRKVSSSWDLDPDQFVGLQNIVLAGMGGSAIGGDLLRNYLQTKLQIPFAVVRNYSLPEYVDDESLVVVSSYSGNTEETLSMLGDALERKAMVVAVSTGGQVSEIARSEGFPLMTVPGGMQPRAALAYSTVPVLTLFELLGFVKDTAPDLSEAILHLTDEATSLCRETPEAKNPAKQIAASFEGKIPLIYAGPGLLESVAVRWRGQMSENGKSLAYSNTFPEMNHNELVGWSGDLGDLRDKLAVVLLSDEDDNPRIKLRQDFFAQSLKDKGVVVHQLASSGGSRLARLFSLVQIGDFTSYYLSAINGVDPTPVEAIENLKSELAKV